MSAMGHTSGCGLVGACAGVIAVFLIGTFACEGWSCIGLAPIAAVSGATIGLVLGLIFGVITRKSETLQTIGKVAALMVGLLVAGVIAYQLLMPLVGN